MRRIQNDQMAQPRPSQLPPQRTATSRASRRRSRDVRFPRGHRRHELPPRLARTRARSLSECREWVKYMWCMGGRITTGSTSRSFGMAARCLAPLVHGQEAYTTVWNFSIGRHASTHHPDDASSFPLFDLHPFSEKYSSPERTATWLTLVGYPVLPRAGHWRPSNGPADCPGGEKFYPRYCD